MENNEYNRVYENTKKIWNDFEYDIINKNRTSSGEGIINILKRHGKDGNHIVGCRIGFQEGEFFYRGRKGTHTCDNMYEPPEGMASDGRCNLEGISHLYLATDKDTVKKEIRAEAGEVITIAKFQVKEAHIFSFSLTKTWEKFMGKTTIKDLELRALVDIINLKFGKEISPNKKIEYRPYQFITEYIKTLDDGKYSGISYQSTVGEGRNYMLFNSDNAQIVELKHEVVK